jgi:hypothetical protein
LNWFDIFLGLVARDLWRERRQQKQREREWIDARIAEDNAIRADWERLEREVLQVLEGDFQRMLAVSDRILEGPNDDQAVFLETWADWGRRAAPTLERLVAEFREVRIPSMARPEAIDVKWEAIAALERVIEGARLLQEGDFNSGGPTVQEGMGMWSAMFEHALSLSSPADRRHWESRYQEHLESHPELRERDKAANDQGRR